MGIEFKVRDKVTNFENHKGVQSVFWLVNPSGILYDPSHIGAEQEEDNVLKRLNIDLTKETIIDPAGNYVFDVVKYFKRDDLNLPFDKHAQNQFVNCLEGLINKYIPYFDIDPKEEGESIFIGNKEQNVHFHIKGSRGDVAGNILLIFDNQTTVTRRNVELQIAYNALEYMANLGEKIADVAHELKRLPTQAGGFVNRILKKVNERSGQIREDSKLTMYVLNKINAYLDQKKDENGIIYNSMKKIREYLLNTRNQQELVFHEKNLEHLTCVKNSIDSSELQINDLNEYTRNKVTYSDINLNDLLEGILQKAQYNHPEINIQKTRYEQVPHIYGDVSRIESIASNLVYNALQKDASSVIVNLYQKNDNNIFEVKDNGHNIPDIDKIFEEGYTTKSNGNGRGLPIVKRCIEFHKGRIEVENDPVTFRVYLPIRPYEI